MTPNRKKFTILLALVLVSVFSIGYWLESFFYVATDDAYLNANIVQMAARVSGRVNQVFISNNQTVKAGDVLFTLDPEPFQIAVQQAAAQLAMQNATLKLAQVNSTRTLQLARQRYASAQEKDVMQSNLQTALAAVQLAQANLAQAKLNLSYTQVIAPCDGWISNDTLQTGDMINANQPLFALINKNEFWVDANFKETDLAKLQTGMAANIKIDMYGKQSFQGVIESISSGTGAAFSLFPPENATGNWVKVTQRVPVRIRLMAVDEKFPLRIGTTAVVRIKV